MFEEYLSRTYEELFEEFSIKVPFLQAKPYKNSRTAICKNIGVTPENLIAYLNGSKTASREKLTDMLGRLNQSYGPVFSRSELLPPALKPYDLANTSTWATRENAFNYETLNIQIQALTEMFFESLQRSEGKTTEQLQEELNRKKNEIAQKNK